MLSITKTGVSDRTYENSRSQLTYNSRLQINQAWAAVNNNGNNWLLYFNFGYGSTNNNGNLLGVNEQVGNSVPWGLDDAVQPELQLRQSEPADGGGRFGRLVEKFRL